MKILVSAFITALLVFTLATVWIDMVEPRLSAMSAAASSYANANRRIANRAARDDIDDDEDPLSTDVQASRSKRKSRSRAKEADEKKERVLAQLEQVRNEEAKLFERQQTMKLLYDDIFKVLAEDEASRRRSATELALAEQRILESPVKNPNATANSTGAEFSATQSAQRKAVAEARIAEMVQSLANRGSTSAAAVLLSGLQEREAAKVLSLLNTRNPRLAQRLSTQVQAARQEADQRF